MEKIVSIGEKIELCTTFNGKENLIQSTISDFGFYNFEGFNQFGIEFTEENGEKVIHPMWMIAELAESYSLYPAKHSQFMKEYRVARYINEKRKNDLTFDNPYTDLPTTYLISVKVFKERKLKIFDETNLTELGNSTGKYWRKHD